MLIDFNAQSYPVLIQSMVVFTDVPNVLRFRSQSTTGTPTTIEIQIDDAWFTDVEAEGQFFITIEGDSITNCLDPQDSANKKFYIADNSEDTAFFICNALRNCANVYAKFYIEYLSTGNIRLTARENGYQNVSSETNATDYLDFTVTQGTSQDEMLNAKIYIDLYNGNDYINTIYKNASEGLCRFNVSPLVAPLAEIGKATPFTLKAYSLKGDTSTELTTINSNIAYGYKIEDSTNYIGNISGNIQPAQVVDNMELYIYNKRLTFSLYHNLSNTPSISLTVNYLDATKTAISTETQTVTLTNNFTDVVILLDETLLRRSFFIKVDIPNYGYIQYSVIKPYRATDFCERISWRNEYGGISFFDFTDKQVDDRQFNTKTYNRSLLNYYQDDQKSEEKVYSKEVNTTYTLVSHLLGENGIKIFESMAKSKFCWVNDKEVILDEINVEETDVKNVYQASVKYHNSLKI